MIKIHHSGKMGDVIYALPVMRALNRIFGEKIHLTTSGLCWQLVPLLWEQPYFEDVVVDEMRAYSIPQDTGVSLHWDFYAEGEGINLSLQPKYYDLDSPINWTMAAARIAGVGTLESADFVTLPSLVNHRRWYHGVKVVYDGKPVTMAPTVVLAPEVESLASAPQGTWRRIAELLHDTHLRVIMIGKHQTDLMPDYVTDLRGLTTVASMARIIAEASVFIGAHSLPWHLARHSGVPALCLQGWREGLRRCVPVDTLPELAPWVEPDRWDSAVEWAIQQGGGYEQSGRTRKSGDHVFRRQSGDVPASGG